MQRFNSRDSDRRFMTLIKMYMISMTSIGILLGFYASNWLGGFIGFIWLGFICSAATVALLGLLNPRKGRVGRVAKFLPKRELLECLKE